MTWNRALFIAKLKALATHIAISLLLVGIALALMLLHWFPPPLFSTDGGGAGLKLLLLVDLVLGPLLTFVVFNPQKTRRHIALDLGVIAALQLAAYGAGLWSIHSVRVQAVAFHEGVFHAVAASDFKQQEIDPASWDALGSQAPYLVAVRPAANAEESKGVTAYAITTGLAPQQLQFLYQPLSAAAAPLREQGWSWAALQTRQPAVAAVAEAWLKQHDTPAVDTLRFHRVEGFYRNAVLVFDADGQWHGGFKAELPAFTSSPSPRS